MLLTCTVKHQFCKTKPLPANHYANPTSLCKRNKYEDAAHPPSVRNSPSLSDPQRITKIEKLNKLGGDVETIGLKDEKVIVRKSGILPPFVEVADLPEMTKFDLIFANK